MLPFFLGSGCWQHSPFLFTPLHLLFSRQLTDISGSGASGDDGGLWDKWKGGGQIFYEWGSASHRKLFMRWWDGGWGGWGVLEWKGGKGAKVLFDAGGERKREKQIRREGGGENRVNERVMERTVKERERGGRPHRMNESDAHSSMASLLAELQPRVHYVSWAARAHVTSQKHGRSPGERERESHTAKQTRDWLDALYGRVASRLTDCSRTDSVIDSRPHLFCARV